jgi:biotin carboxylase
VLSRKKGLALAACLVGGFVCAPAAFPAEALNEEWLHKDRELIEHGASVAEAVRIKGPANVQCFREPDGSLPITDVNTRFGGGFPVPLAAGGRYPELALALARGERPEPTLGDFQEGVAMTRYFSEVCLAPDPDGVLQPLP